MKMADWRGAVALSLSGKTAKGVVFVTLEDEAGTINVICWPDLVEQQHTILLGATMLGVYGRWQNQNNVRHLVAMYLVDLSPMIASLAVASRDFH